VADSVKRLIGDCTADCRLRGSVADTIENPKWLYESDCVALNHLGATLGDNKGQLILKIEDDSKDVASLDDKWEAAYTANN